MKKKLLIIFAGLLSLGLSSCEQVINRELLFIKNNPQRDIPVIITFFKSDGRKDGGAYIEKEVRIKKIDEINRKLILSDYSEIKIDDIFSVRIKEK